MLDLTKAVSIADYYNLVGYLTWQPSIGTLNQYSGLLVCIMFKLNADSTFNIVL